MEKDSSHLVYDQILSIDKWKYSLLTQISHEGQYDTGRYKVCIVINKKWFEIEDLEVK